MASSNTSTGNSAMTLETGSGWSRGLRNLLRAELGAWFGTRTWLSQILIWASAVNLIYLFASLGMRGNAPPSDAIMVFNVFMGLAGPIGVTIVMQDAIIGEKRSGTAAWVLSKPVSRLAFIVAKLVANSLGIAVTMVLAQGVIAYFITGLINGQWLPLPGYLAALGIHFANILFYLTLTILLGVLFDHPAPVIGIPLAFLFSQNFLAPQLAQWRPALANAFPWTLAVPVNGGGGLGVAGALMLGQPTPLLALYVALTAAAVFMVLAVALFRRQEL